MRFRSVVRDSLLGLLGVFLLVGLGALAGCGKFQAPYVPEAVTPDVVASLAASATKNAVIISWSSPSKNRRDKKLKDLDGYRVERKQIVTASDINPDTFAVVGPQSGFSLVTEIKDESLANLEDLLEKAREDHKPSRRIKPDSTFTTFKYEDTDIEPGDQFIYRVVPVNRYGTGRVARLARVVFRGLGSDITYPEPSPIDEDLNFNPFQ